MTELGVGLIGTGFMGKCHALAHAAVGRVFGDVAAPRLEVVCDTPLERAEAMARQFGFARASDDWRSVVADPAVGLVSITTPNRLHREMALAAVAAGKHVWCEKPMGLTLAEAEAMAEAAEAAGVVTMVGYNYIAEPGVRACAAAGGGGGDRAGGAFPRVRRRGLSGGPGAGLDLAGEARGGGAGGARGSRVPSGQHGLRASGRWRAWWRTWRRCSDPAAGGRQRAGAVENEDVASALLRFEGGVTGVISTSRAAWGRKNRLGWEVHGERGMIGFEQERMNELRLFVNEGPAATQGFRTILTGPAHPPFAAFVPAPGHQLGFNDLKVIEAADLLRAIAAGGRAVPGLPRGARLRAGDPWRRPLGAGGGAGGGGGVGCARGLCACAHVVKALILL